MEFFAHLIFILMGLMIFLAFIAVVKGVAKETRSDDLIERLFDDEKHR